MLAACAAVQVVCRARQEEVHGTAEPLLAAPVGRVRWLAGYLLVGLVAIVLVVAAAMAGAAAGIASQDGDMDLMRTVLVTGAGQVAAASVFLVVTALAFVLAPRVTIPLGWTLVLLGMTLGLFGPLFQFPEWLVHLSPIAVTPFVDGDEIDMGRWMSLPSRPIRPRVAYWPGANGNGSSSACTPTTTRPSAISSHRLRRPL